MSYLLLVRHGESRWNLANKFTGWVDIPLSEAGLKEAILIAKRMGKLKLDIAFTSNLERARETLLAILSKQHCTGVFMHEESKMAKKYQIKLDKLEIPIHTSWLLNERHYGVLQGMNKNQAAKKFGLERVYHWRRGYLARPPKGESLKDVYERVVPYFKEMILPAIKKNKNVLVVAHGNTLRSLIKYIDKVSERDIPNLELTPNHPFIYKYSGGVLKKVFKGYSFSRPILWK